MARARLSPSSEDILATLRSFFEANQDERYARFSASLNPSPRPQVGVRMPVMRQKARAMIKAGESEAYLQAVQEAWKTEPTLAAESEWFTLGGILIGRDSHLPLEVRDAAFLRWLSEVDGWGAADLLGSEQHQLRTRPDWAWRFMRERIAATRIEEPATMWATRVAIVIALAHFRTVLWLDSLEALLTDPALITALSIYHERGEMRQPKPITTPDGTRWPSAEGYYLSMAVAWCWASFFVVDPTRLEATLVRLNQTGRLDPWTCRRIVSKVRDSLAVSDEAKAHLKAVLIPREP